VVLVVGYLVLVEAAKRVFYREVGEPAARSRPAGGHRHVRRRAARFSIG